MSNEDFKEGVSIIVPCTRPNEYLGKLLDSIYNQQGLNQDFIEVILVFNGYNEFIIEKFTDKLEKLKTKHQVRLLYNSVGSASKARNIGLEASTRSFICFCDDDDWIGVNYINNLYKVSDLSNIAFAPIIDVSMDGKKESREDINRFLKSDNSNDLSLYSRALTLNACKLIPTIYAKKVNFDEALMSGEDVVYFCEYVSRFRPSFAHVNNGGCYYYRLKTKDSTSRQSMSYEFNVEQRLDVIKKLVDLATADLNNFFQSKINAQLSFLNKYFIKNSNSLSSIRKSFESRSLSDLTMFKNDRFYINLS
ncbi:glycosyltransferase family 2 protein [Psychrobacter sp. AT9]|uniref:glycosyltransferase family 2 protein n=1 Tax=Psychrobacter sp. AT9 TaxID=3242893 RepID=UPI0039A68905